MSRFLSLEAQSLAPYTPGEQPQDQSYCKLNTNESPFPPSPAVLRAINRAEIGKLNLYPDPDCSLLLDAAAAVYELKAENIIPGNGSDEILSFAFRAFCGAGKPCAFADVTYGFYKTWAKLYGIEAKVIPLREDFTLAIDDYLDFPGTIFIANPNAPTGLALPRSEIQRLLDADPNRVVVVDEAYVDFGAESCIPMLYRYDNLLVVQTLSKSRSLAGARLGFGFGSPALIEDLNRVKYSHNPYNINRLTMASGAAALRDRAYFEACCASVQAAREWTREELEALGASVLPSRSNFLFVKLPGIGGHELYARLKEQGVLVRHFSAPRTQDFIRVTIGSMEQMQTFMDAFTRIAEEVA